MQDVNAGGTVFEKRVWIEVRVVKLKIAYINNNHYYFTESIVRQSEGLFSWETGDYRAKCPAVAAGGQVAWAHPSPACRNSGIPLLVTSGLAASLSPFVSGPEGREQAGEAPRGVRSPSWAEVAAKGSSVLTQDRNDCFAAPKLPPLPPPTSPRLLPWELVLEVPGLQRLPRSCRLARGFVLCWESVPSLGSLLLVSANGQF